MGSAVVLGTVAVFSGIVGALNINNKNYKIGFAITFATGIVFACCIAAIIESV